MQPSRISFLAQEGGLQPAGQRITIRNAGGGRVAWHAQADAVWLRVAPADGTEADTPIVAADPAELSPGTYEGRVTISAPGASNSAQVIRVVLTIAPRRPQAGPSLKVTPDKIRFSAQIAEPAQLRFDLRLEAEPKAALEWTATASARWIVISPASGTTPSQVAVSVDEQTRPTGADEGTITIRANGASNAAVVIPVTFERAAAGPLRLEGNPQLPNAVMNVPYSHTLPAQGGQPPYFWRISGGQLPAELALLSGTLAGVPRVPGSFIFTITLVDSANPPAVVSRTFSLNALILEPGATLLVEPVRLEFRGGGREEPSPRTLRIADARGAALGWWASSTASWLIVSPPGGSAPADLTVRTSTRGLKPGTYSTTLTLLMPGALNSPFGVPVTLTVP